VDEHLVVRIELMNERGEFWRVIGSGRTVDEAVAVVEQWANSRPDHIDSFDEWVMNEWRAL
jgi:hypothetical protein